MPHFDALAEEMAAMHRDRQHFFSRLKEEVAQMRQEVAKMLGDFRSAFNPVRQDAKERAASFRRLVATVQKARSDGSAPRASGGPPKRGKRPSDEEE